MPDSSAVVSASLADAASSTSFVVVWVFRPMPCGRASTTGMNQGTPTPTHKHTQRRGLFTASPRRPVEGPTEQQQACVSDRRRLHQSPPSTSK